MKKQKENKAIQILSDITVHMKYARFLPELNRRETWDEIVSRNEQMHIKTYPQLEEEIHDIYTNFIRTRKILPSMRSMQFGGKPVEISPNRVYNCAYMPIDSYIAFSESMFLPTLILFLFLGELHFGSTYGFFFDKNRPIHFFHMVIFLMENYDNQ